MHPVTCSGLGSLECFVIIKCSKFGQLILRKIIKIVATRCQILRLKCTKFDFGCGSLQRSPDPLAGFKGPTSKREGGKMKGEREGKERVRERGGRGKREERGKRFPCSDFTI